MAEPTYRYRALEPIAVGGVRAYNIGDWVPDENVDLHEYEVGVQVERVEIPPIVDEAKEPTPAVQQAEATPPPPPAAKAPAKKTIAP